MQSSILKTFNKALKTFAVLYQHIIKYIFRIQFSLRFHRSELKKNIFLPWKIVYFDMDTACIHVTTLIVFPQKCSGLWNSTARAEQMEPTWASLHSKHHPKKWQSGSCALSWMFRFHWISHRVSSSEAFPAGYGIPTCQGHAMCTQSGAACPMQIIWASSGTWKDFVHLSLGSWVSSQAPSTFTGLST